MKLVKVHGPPNRNLFKRKSIFWVRKYRAGKGRLEESLDTDNLTEARLRRDARIAEFFGEMLLSKKAEVFLVEEKFPIFLELKKTKAKGTYESINNQWANHLKGYFGNFLLDEITETSWLQYVAKKRESLPDRKFFNDRKYLSMFLNWLHREGFITRLPKLPDVDPEIKEGRVYSDEQIASLLQFAELDLYLQILMAVTMGMRVGEILSLEWTQIDFTKKTIHLPAEKTKIRKARTFGISSQCLDLLIHRHQNSRGAAVFASPEDPNKTRVKGGNKRSWATCKRLAGVADMKFHFLRHTFLTRAFKQAVNPALICEYAGLSLEEAQKTYLHFSIEDTRVVANLVEVSL